MLVLGQLSKQNSSAGHNAEITGLSSYFTLMKQQCDGLVHCHSLLQISLPANLNGNSRISTQGMTKEYSVAETSRR